MNKYNKITHLILASFALSVSGYSLAQEGDPAALIATPIYPQDMTQNLQQEAGYKENNAAAYADQGNVASGNQQQSVEQQQYEAAQQQVNLDTSTVNGDLNGDGVITEEELSAAQINAGQPKPGGAVRPNLTNPPPDEPVQYFDTHAELTKEQIDESIKAGMVPRPASEGPVRLPNLQPPKGDRVDRILEKKYPLSANETRVLRERVKELEKAQNENDAADTVGRTISMSLQDVRKIPKISISPGYIANMSFLDQYGNPWKVVGKSVGNIEFFNVIDLGQGISNQIQIRGIRDYGTSNLIVLLEDSPAPLVFDLTGAGKNDSRVDVIVAGTAPGGQTPQPQVVLPPEANTAYSDTMVSLRNGIVPNTLESLQTNAALKAYRDKENGDMYIVTTNEVIQPQCSAIVHGNAGLRICKLDYSTSSLLYVVNGQVVTAKINLGR